MKKLICFLIAILMTLSLAACGQKEVAKTEEELKAEIKAEMEAEQAKEEAEAEVEKLKAELDEVKSKLEDEKEKDDEIVITYAYGSIDGIDVSELDEVVFDGMEATSDAASDGKVCEYKMAFFGQVNNVKINYSGYVYEDMGIEIASYDSFKDTVFTIKSNDLVKSDYHGIFVSFEDGRGIERMFIIGDEMVEERGKVELISGFTALEKTPSNYAPYDMTDIINSIGITTEEFESSEMMQYAEKELMDGMDYQYNVYTIKNLVKGIEVKFSAPDSDYIISNCNIMKNEELYESLSEEEKYSFLGMDFDMSFVRANHNKESVESLSDIRGMANSEDDIIDFIALYK